MILLDLPSEVAQNARFILDFWTQISFGDPIVFLLFLSGVLYTLFIYFGLDARFVTFLLMVFLFLGAITFSSPLSSYVIGIVILLMIFVFVFIVSQIAV